MISDEQRPLGVKFPSPNNKNKGGAGRVYLKSSQRPPQSSKSHIGNI